MTVWYTLRWTLPLWRAASVLLTLSILASAPGMTPAAWAGSDPPGEPVPVSVFVDIRPGLCPNHLRTESHLTIPIAILGTVDFEVAQVDPGTVRLSRNGVNAEVKPASWTYEDVGTPLIGGVCACHKLRGDGLDDLEFIFTIEDVVEALGLEELSGETIKLALTGELMTDEAMVGEDCVEIISGQLVDDEMGDEIGMLTEAGTEPASGPFEFSYYTTVSDRITFAVYDVHGRVVARLADMDMAPGIYSATWDGMTQSREPAPAGIYFARVSNSWAWDTRKIILGE